MYNAFQCFFTVFSEFISGYNGVCKDRDVLKCCGPNFMTVYIIIPLFGDVFFCSFSSDILVSSSFVCITLAVTSCKLPAVFLVSRFN